MNGTLKKERILDVSPKANRRAERAHSFGGLYFEGRPSSLPPLSQTGTARQDLETHN